MPAWVTTATRRTPAGDDVGQLVASTGPDEDVVGAIGQRDGDDDHAPPPRGAGAGQDARTSATDASTGRVAVDDAASATSAS